MTTNVSVRCESSSEGWTCDIAVDDGDGRPTAHVVTVAAADLARLAPGAVDPEDLVTRSFDFLLAREPKSSILRTFDLLAIAHYFPEYERAIRG